MAKNITLDDIKKNEEIMLLIEASCKSLNAMNYTEHGLRHASIVSSIAYDILKKLGFDERTQELAHIAGFIHDVGNMINRKNHGIISATLLYPILKDMGMPIAEVTAICSAIGNHEEEIGTIVNPICAALVIADKADAHRTRVRRDNYDLNDIHDRVNYSIIKNIVEVDAENKKIKSKYYMNDLSSIFEYFEIYLNRIIFSEKAAEFLGCYFDIYINDIHINSQSQKSQRVSHRKGDIKQR